MTKIVMILCCLMANLGWGNSSYYIEVSSPNEVQILNRGASALEKRLQMIDRAQQTVVLETFTYDVDFLGKVLTAALIEKAREGVEVRILVDSFGGTYSALDEFYAYFLAQEGVEVRYYNTSPVALLRYNHRNHRKLLIVDGEELLAGGRNVSSKYFELSTDFNFIDRDIWVKSRDLATAALETFEDYWNSDFTWSFPSHFPRRLRRRHIEKRRMAREFIRLTDDERKTIAALREFGREQLRREPPVGSCERIAFVSDPPRDPSDASRELSVLLERHFLDVENSLTIESGYLVPDKANKGYWQGFLEWIGVLPPDHTRTGVLQEVLERGNALSLLTNSFYASDRLKATTMVDIIFNNRIAKLVGSGARVFVYSGRPLPGHEFFFEGTDSSLFAVHAKSFVFDDHSFMVGSYNLDHRSQTINSEVGIFCYGNPDLAQRILDDIRVRQENSIELDEEGRYPIFYHMPTSQWLLYYIPSHLLDFLL